MSIYATLWALRFPERGDFHHGCSWTTVHALRGSGPRLIGEVGQADGSVRLIYDDDSERVVAAPAP